MVDNRYTAGHASEEESPGLRQSNNNNNLRKVDAITGVTGSQAAAIRAMGGNGPRDRRNDDLN